MITIEVAQHFQEDSADRAGLERLVRNVCKRFGVTRAAVSIGVVDDAEMSKLNKKYLNRSGTTDCLSFDLSDESVSTEGRVFDLIVNGELAVREAARRGHSGRAELALYVTHGLLHHLGFNDATAEQAREMHRAEDEILQHLGYGLIYNSRAHAP